MFGNNNNNNSADISAASQKTTSTISNRINHGTVFTGEVESNDDIRIEGTIRGTLNTKSKVAVGQTGLIEGDVYCKTADVEGRIIGDIEVSELLTLKSSCMVEGNIYTNKIVIENGARFNGVCTMGTKDKEKSKDKEINQNGERTFAALEQEAAV